MYNVILYLEKLKKNVIFQTAKRGNYNHVFNFFFTLLYLLLKKNLCSKLHLLILHRQANKNSTLQINPTNLVVFSPQKLPSQLFF